MLRQRSASRLNARSKIFGANFTSIKPCREIVGSAAKRLLHVPLPDYTSVHIGHKGGEVAAVSRPDFWLDTRRNGASGYALDARFSPRCPLPLLSRAKDDAAIEPNHSARAETCAKV